MEKFRNYFLWSESWKKKKRKPIYAVLLACDFKTTTIAFFEALS